MPACSLPTSSSLLSIQGESQALGDGMVAGKGNSPQFQFCRDFYSLCYADLRACDYSLENNNHYSYRPGTELLSLSQINVSNLGGWWGKITELGN